MKGSNKMGFGFGSAMFAMKDLQDQYSQFDQKPQQIKKVSQPKRVISNPKSAHTNTVQNNKSIQVKDSEKPKLILKSGNITRIPSTLPYKQQQLLRSTSTKKVFPSVNNNNLRSQKVQLKQQVKVIKVKSMKLQSIQVSKNIFELTTSSKRTQWGYTNLSDSNSKPAFSIIPNPQISFSFHQRNIKQGNIGNCYFICSLAALAPHTQHLKQRIPDHQQYNQQSQYFYVNIFESGKLVNMKVTNAFNQSYSKPINNDITALVLQKAYAQVYGGYDIMTLGHSIDAFRDLSGQVAEYIDLKNQQKMKQQIIEAFQKNHPMVIASKQTTKSQDISAKHSYNVLSYWDKNNNFYIELRDPRGWTKANFSLPLALQSNIQNGQFWIPYKDLVQNFQVITVSRFMKNFFYYYKTFGSKDLIQNGLGIIYFKIHKLTRVSASIHQKHKKFFDSKHQYSVVSVMLCEVDDGMSVVRTLQCDFNSNQVCSLTFNLQKGTYAVIGQIHPFKTNQHQKFSDQVFTLSLNTNSEINQFGLLNELNVTRALSLYMKQNGEEFKHSVSKQNLHRYHGSLFGKVCIFYENMSQKKVIEELQFDVENVEIKQKKVMLGKGESKLIVCPIGPANNCSHRCAFKSKTYYSK